MDVMLRPWRPEDAPSIARHADDPQVAANLRDVFPCPYQLSDAEEFIRLCRAAEPEQAIFRAIVVDGQAVGSVALTGCLPPVGRAGLLAGPGPLGPGHHDQGGGGDVPDGL